MLQLQGRRRLFARPKARYLTLQIMVLHVQLDERSLEENASQLEAMLVGHMQRLAPLLNMHGLVPTCQGRTICQH